jgi:hypothetical protein
MGTPEGGAIQGAVDEKMRGEYSRSWKEQTDKT